VLTGRCISLSSVEHVDEAFPSGPHVFWSNQQRAACEHFEILCNTPQGWNQRLHGSARGAGSTGWLLPSAPPSKPACSSSPRERETAADLLRPCSCCRWLNICSQSAPSSLKQVHPALGWARQCQAEGVHALFRETGDYAYGGTPLYRQTLTPTSGVMSHGSCNFTHVVPVSFGPSSDFRLARSILPQVGGTDTDPSAPRK
jgi:hypothetical protein